MTEEVIRNKLKFIIHWIFSDIAINIRSDAKIWENCKKNKEKVFDYEFEIGESNIGSIQLICAGIETFGRILDGRKDDRNCSQECFTNFVEKYFSAAYKGLSATLYTKYRCSLLHSHVLGFKTTLFPNRYLRNSEALHLYFGDEDNSSFQPDEDSVHQRMIIDIDVFYNDFKAAVEKYCSDIFRSTELKKNALHSLEDLPED